ACRKRSGLTQGELAELCGSNVSSIISRLESGARRPTLETVVFFEIVFAILARELLHESFREMRQRTNARARALRARLAAEQPEAAHKLEFLDALITQTES